MKIAFVNGSWVDTRENCVKQGNLLVENGVITHIGTEEIRGAEEIIDASGWVIAPSFVDLHVHLRDPGFTHKEDLYTGAAAAAAGGYTTVCAMPNTRPVCDCPQVIEDILARGASAAAQILPIGAVTEQMRGKKRNDFAALKGAGAVAVSDDGRPVFDNELLRQTMEACKRLPIPVMLHCEDLSVTGKGIMNEGSVSRGLGVPGVPSASEDVSTAAAIALADDTGCACHICHVSTKGALAMIRDAKRRGVPVTCEVTPHHMMLTEELLRSRSAHYRMAPPLRTALDTAAVQAALMDGTADCIATDHAPHTAQEKADFMSAPNGVVGLETAFAAAYTCMVRTGMMSLPRLIEKMSINPAKIIGLPSREIRVGAPADLVLIDLSRQWTVEPERLHSKSKNTAFAGQTLQGKVMMTFRKGQQTFSYHLEEDQL